MALKYLNFTGLTDLVTNLMNWVTSRIPTKTSEIDNDSGYLTASDLPTNHVTTNTTQTISAAKTFTGGVTLSSNAKVAVKHASVVKGTNPSGTCYWQIFNCDKNGGNWGTNTLSIIEGALNSSGKSSIYFRACKNEASSTVNGTLSVIYDTANNKTWAECPTPDASSNDNKIATTAWVTAKGYLTSHQSLSNYSTLANTVKSLSISGKTITVTPGSGSAYTLTTQDTVYTHPTTSGNKHIPSGGSSGQFLGWDSDGTAKWVNNPNTNTDTLMTQNVSTTNATYPVLLVATADATANQGAKTGIFAKSVKVNPSTNIVSANGFSGAPNTNYVQGVKDGGAVVNSQTTSFGAVWRAPTKNYQVAGATFPSNNDNVYICYSVTNANVTAGTNTTAKMLTWGADTGTLTANAFSGPLTGNVTGDVTGNVSGYSTSLLTTTVFGNDRLTYTEGGIPLGSDAGKLFKGSSNNATLVSAPENGTYFSGSAGNVQNLRFTWAGDGKYLHDIFVSPNNNYIWHRDVVNGTAKPWRRVVEENATGLTNQTWNINIGGSSGSCTGNAATATQFSANKSVTLTGDVTGTASSKAGWSVATTLANSGVTAGTYGPSADVTGNNNSTISVPQITVDAKGRVTSVVNKTLTCKNNTYNVYNKTLTIQKNGTNVATFTSNSNTDVTANIVVPTKISDLTNDSNFVTSNNVSSAINSVVIAEVNPGYFTVTQNRLDNAHATSAFAISPTLCLPSVGVSNAYDIDTTNWNVSGGDIHVVVQDANSKTVPGYVMIYLSKCAATDFVIIQLTSMARSAGIYVPTIKSGSNYYVKACFPTSGDFYVNIVKTAGTIGYAKLYPFLGNFGFVAPS